MAKSKKSAPNSAEIKNAAKTLFANIRFQSVDKPIRSILITSSVPNEGKTTTILNLAQAIATAGRRVLLVEADMRKRSLAGIMNLHPPVGIHSVLTEDCSLWDAIVETPMPNLFFIDVEPSIPNPADLIASKRFRRFTEQLVREFDYVLYDTPPVSTFVDAAILSTLVDGVVFVVRENFVKRSDLELGYEQLTKAEANVLGICATFVEGSSSEYYYAYYSQSGKRIEGTSASASAAGASPVRSVIPAASKQMKGPSQGSHSN